LYVPEFNPPIEIDGDLYIRNAGADEQYSQQSVDDG
jgi:hypothetical protein